MREFQAGTSLNSLRAGCFELYNVGEQVSERSNAGLHGLMGNMFHERLDMMSVPERAMINQVWVFGNATRQNI